MTNKKEEEFFSDSAIITVKRDELYKSLSLQQKAIFNYVVFERKSIFFSGQAGSGKSYLLRAIIEKLQALIPGNALAVTAMTGIAAVNIKGVTLHSLFASTLQMDSDNLEQNIHQALKLALSRKQIREELQQIEVLIVDEVSMLQSKQFDALSVAFERIKHKYSLFGGIELILVGDFLELPPIEKNGEAKMLFESEQFEQIKQVQLTNEFRQKDDNLARVLNKIREGVIDEQVMAMLGSRVRNEMEVNKQEKIQLEQAYQAYQHNISAAESNLKALPERCKKEKLLGAAHIIRKVLQESAKVLNSQFIPPRFAVRLYAYKRQVDFYNQSMLSSLRREVYTVVACDQGKIDKIDSLDKEINISIGSEVMLRKNLAVSAGMCNGTVGVIVDILYKNKEKQHKATLDAFLDDVTIVFTSGSAVLSVKCTEQDQTEQNGKVKVGSRKEIPFMLCYAISIHKSEGLTLEAATISLDKCFENGQAYVALSRIKDLEHLNILGIDYNCIKASEKCIDYHKTILKLDENEPESFSNSQMFNCSSGNLISEEVIDSAIEQVLETTRVRGELEVEKDQKMSQEQLLLILSEEMLPCKNSVVDDRNALNESVTKESVDAAIEQEAEAESSLSLINEQYANNIRSNDSNEPKIKIIKSNQQQHLEAHISKHSTPTNENTLPNNQKVLISSISRASEINSQSVEESIFKKANEVLQIVDLDSSHSEIPKVAEPEAKPKIVIGGLQQLSHNNVLNNEKAVAFLLPKEPPQQEPASAGEENSPESSTEVMEEDNMELDFSLSNEFRQRSPELAQHQQNESSDLYKYEYFLQFLNNDKNE